MSNCRSCQAEIEWVETKNGKQMPMDVAESPCKKCAGVGMLTATMERCPTCNGAGHLRLSHFATCPTAAQHRRPK